MQTKEILNVWGPFNAYLMNTSLSFNKREGTKTKIKHIKYL